MGRLLVAIRAHLHAAGDAVETLCLGRDKFTIVTAGTVFQNFATVLFLLHAFELQAYYPLVLIFIEHLLQHLIPDSPLSLALRTLACLPNLALPQTFKNVPVHAPLAEQVPALLQIDRVLSNRLVAYQAVERLFEEAERLGEDRRLEAMPAGEVM